MERDLGAAARVSARLEMGLMGAALVAFVGVSLVSRRNARWVDEDR